MGECVSDVEVPVERQKDLVNLAKGVGTFVGSVPTATG